ncbi:peptidyl-tRNA hydrolase II (PTH2) family protein [Wolffia australiana]
MRQLGLSSGLGLPLRRPPPTSHWPRRRSSAAATTMSAEPDPAAPPRSADASRVVQYVVLRRDLIDSWPFGSVVTQGCHAAVAAVWAHRDHPDTLAYCSPSNLDSMHKVTLEVKGEAQIRNLSEKLAIAGIDHKLWIEQPENTPTCIATRPCPKPLVAPFFKNLKLCK